MPKQAFRRPVFAEILARAHEPRRFIQVLAGPRQVGKTTLARQVIDAVGVPAHIASADDPTLQHAQWLETQWAIGRERARNGGRAGGLLVLDEVQKVAGWSDTVKALWDEDTRNEVQLRVMLLGSAPLLVRQGLSDSLAGRFEIIRVGHWSFAEMRDAFGWDLDRYLFFGGYPGAAPLIGRQSRWEAYILDSLVETTLSRDILLLNRVDKPGLLRQLFRLACEHSGRVLSYTKMLPSLPDAGNTVTLAHYLELLGGAGLVTGLAKYSAVVRRRGSTPKLLALTTALVTATRGVSFERARADPAFWSQLVETAVGAHLWAHAEPEELTYWREGNAQVDYVVGPGSLIRSRSYPTAIVVRLGAARGDETGSAAFAKAHRARSLLIGPRGIELEEFLATDPQAFLDG
jgi:predicted AAA+ superfamily ATPase